MKDLTAYIQWLSDSVYSVYSFGLTSWISNYSNQIYFTRSYDRMAYDSAKAGYTDIQLWAEDRLLAGEYYETQDIPPEYSDLYYYAAERARVSGMIRSRMPFHRPPYQGFDLPGGPTRKQRAVRRTFKSAIDKFNTLDYTSRSEIYDRSTPLGLWYYNFFIAGALQMIKFVHRAYCTVPPTGYGTATWGFPVDTTRAIVNIRGAAPVTIAGNAFSLPFFSVFINDTTLRVYQTYGTMSTSVYCEVEILEFY